ncbi:MAG: 50S ribosomal protein L13 [Nitrospirae bacterium]|nr:50S ribosomal protein L13 [Nitrospirota bacterium]
MDSSQKWYLVNAEGQIVGRLATRIATLLRGKHKPEFAPHLDIGDHVVVVNAEKVRFTGDKWDTKIYHRHTGYPGGLRSDDAAKVRREHPERLLLMAVSGMLPKNKLRKRMLGRLKVYAGPSHPHRAQEPQSISW